MSAPLSSLAISVPSVAVSPSAEEERPLLLAATRQPHKSSGREDKRNSAHYNHGHEAHSLPSSPRFTKQNGDYQLTGDHAATAAVQELVNTNNNNDYRTKIPGVNNGHTSDKVQSKSDSLLEGETEEEPQGDATPFLAIESSVTLLLRAMERSRTNPASPKDDLQVGSPSATTKLDPCAV